MDIEAPSAEGNSSSGCCMRMVKMKMMEALPPSRP